MQLNPQFQTSPVGTALEPKLCERCGHTFFRVIGSHVNECQNHGRKLAAWKMLSKLVHTLALIAFLGGMAHAGTVTGTIAYSNAGSTVNNATLTFTITQPGVVSGTSTVVGDPVNCYTSTAGQVVGVPNPLVAPVLSQNLASGTLGAGTYYVVITYYNGSGESLQSPEASFTLTGTGTLNVAAPVLQPANATGYKVYISTSSGTETLQSTKAAWTSYGQSASLSAGSALPSSNSSACTLYFNDQIIPSNTGYNVNLNTSTGAQVAGYPQRWQLNGGASGTINVSNGTPLWDGYVVYPQALFATPLNNAQQSIAGPLTVTGLLKGTSGLTVSGGTAALGTAATATTFTGTNFAVVSGTGQTATITTSTSNNRSVVIPDFGGTDNLVAAAATQTLTNKTLNADTLQNSLISGGISCTGGTGYKCARQASCTTGGTAFNTCNTTITWGGSAFADTSYTAVCTIDTPTNTPMVVATGGKSTTQMAVTIATYTNAASSGTLNCVAIHD